MRAHYPIIVLPFRPTVYATCSFEIGAEAVTTSRESTAGKADNLEFSSFDLYVDLVYRLRTSGHQVHSKKATAGYELIISFDEMKLILVHCCCG
jgi:hypothetical protein